MEISAALMSDEPSTSLGAAVDTYICAQVMFYVDFKQMATRRLAGNNSASFEALPSNTLWHSTRDPAGLPAARYRDATRRITAQALAAELATLEDQHVVYLNGVPLISEADSVAVTDMLPDKVWTQNFGINRDTSLDGRIQKYVTECAGFGVGTDSLQLVLDKSRAGGNS